MKSMASDGAMRVLLTGAAGFVAPYVVAALRSHAPRSLEFLLTARNASECATGERFEPLDIVNSIEVQRVLKEFRPDIVVHLAGVSDVAAAEVDPQWAWEVNLHGTLHLARATLVSAPDAIFLFAGTSHIYGLTAKSGRPLSEDDLLAPTGEYAASKAAADLALGVLAGRGLRAIRMRPFNHIGPGQSSSFAVPSFAYQIARIEAGLQPAIIRVGNLEAERDFLDVRDVAEAYALAVFKGAELEPGVILNIASGKAYRMRSILDKLIELTWLEIKIEPDASRCRENELSRLLGDSTRARMFLQWAPRCLIEETLISILIEQRMLVSPR